MQRTIANCMSVLHIPASNRLGYCGSVKSTKDVRIYRHNVGGRWGLICESTCSPCAVPRIHNFGKCVQLCPRWRMSEMDVQSHVVSRERLDQHFDGHRFRTV